MPRSLEPGFDYKRWAILIPMNMILAVIAVYGMYHALFGEPPGQLISPAQLRAVVEEYREKRRQRMIEEVGRLHDIARDMRTIRNRTLADAGVDMSEVREALDDEERGLRDLAETDDVASLRFHEIYDVARAIEQDMYIMYREFLSGRMVGMRQGHTYIEAYELNHTPRPTRRELNVQDLYRIISTTDPGGGLDEFKAQIVRSTIECREIIDSSEKLLEFTRRASRSPMDGIAVDLSADDMAMIGYRGPELLPDEIDFTHRPDIGNFAAVPGRRLVRGGVTSDWMYVDSWYIVGPFPSDRRRLNLDTRFGPEASVNLDDVFTGKDDRRIGWDFKKVGWSRRAEGGQRQAFWKIEPRVVDTYAVYYAFTEIYSDVDREVWIAMGTDDYGKLWINDELVWISPREVKPYNATENIQTARLQRGQNKVLFRVENAGGTMGFSMMIKLGVE